MHVSCVDWFYMFLLSLCGTTTCTHTPCAKPRTQQMCRGTILPFVTTWVQVQRHYPSTRVLSLLQITVPNVSGGEVGAITLEIEKQDTRKI